MPKFETLISDVYKLLEGHDLTESVSHFSDQLGKTLADKLVENGKDREPILRMSNIGKPLRQLWYELNRVESEPLEPETRFKFLYGDLIEAMFMWLARSSGHEVTDEQKELEFEGIPGHIDGFIDGVLIDCKSCSPYSFNKFKDGSLIDNDPFGYIAQLSGYREALNVERAAFIAIDKVAGRICIYELPPREDHPYNVRSRIETVREVVSGHNEPERCYPDQPVSKKDSTGNRVIGVGCNYCGWKHHCWRDANGGRGLETRYYSTGPKLFSVLVKEPRLKYNNQEEESPYESFPTKE